jgi:hypothetical protein
MVQAISALVSAAARVRRERLTVLPREDLQVFEVAEDALFVPDFEYLNGELFHAALIEGTERSEVVSYLDSVLRFSSVDAESGGFEGLRSCGRYRTTEDEILRGFASPVSSISEERGLELVREACDELEKQIVSLRRGSKATQAARARANGD